MGWRGLVAGAWFGAGDKGSYGELNRFISYGVELGPAFVHGGYTRLEFPEDDESDNEISVGIEAKVTGYLVPALDYRFSTEADGGFLELSINTEVVVLNGRLSLGPYIMEGFDFGYASRRHDGPNNFQAGIDFAYALTDSLSLVGSVAHSWAHADVKKDGLGEVSWLVIGVSADL